jgi:hypothetical protein
MQEPRSGASFSLVRGRDNLGENGDQDAKRQPYQNMIAPSPHQLAILRAAAYARPMPPVGVSRSWSAYRFWSDRTSSIA